MAEPMLAEAYEAQVARKAKERKLLLANMAAVIAGGVEASLVEASMDCDDVAKRAVTIAKHILDEVGL